jgi:hypothetical protein
MYVGAKMNLSLGKQYLNDDKMDTTGFRSKARLHQSHYRMNILKVDYDEYGNRLIEKDAKAGLNFYSDFNILGEVKTRYNYRKGLYADMLRSEHIPFNLFVPLKCNMALAKTIFDSFLPDSIENIVNIKIEYAPEPAQDYLNDKTSFDAYIEYIHLDKSKGILGIEVKYTEHEYKLVKGSKQEKDIGNKQSKYNLLTNKINLYKSDSYELLKADHFRQMWRNQLLGESIIDKTGSQYKHFTSLLIYPEKNTHFVDVSIAYSKFLLKQKEKKYIDITYEEFIETIENSTKDSKYLNWANYLKDRYLIS